MRTTTATPAAKINIQVELLIGVAAGVPLPAGTPEGAYVELNTVGNALMMPLALGAGRLGSRSAFAA